MLHFCSITTWAIAPFLAAAISVAVPFDDTTSPALEIEPRNPLPVVAARASKASPSSCSPQNPIASNVCSSGSPYCCSGTGKSMVCGPSSTTDCESTTICCMNNNGVSFSADKAWKGVSLERSNADLVRIQMQICAGEVDFTGPVTITNVENFSLLNLNLCLRDEA